MSSSLPDRGGWDESDVGYWVGVRWPLKSQRVTGNEEGKWRGKD